MKKFSKINTLILVFITVFGVITPAGVASAASAYDNTIALTNDLTLSNNFYSCSSQNHESDWSTALGNSSFWSEAVGSSYSTVNSAYATALANASGWSVSQITFNAASSIGNLAWDVGDKGIQITLTADTANAIDFSTRSGIDFAYLHSPSATPVYNVILGLNSSCQMKVAVARSIAGNSPAYQFFDNDVYPIANGIGNRTFEVYSLDSPINYPTGYAGSVPSSDTDVDGLIAPDETTQGTSNAHKDTDGDGLSDYIESQWYTNRQAVFCGTSCTYPNPTSKDLFVEVDWMKDGSHVMKPSQIQLDSVVSAYASQGITAHFDTGQYGGGNELPTYASELYFESDASNLDFYDLKNGNSTYSANFSANRSRIWHYMISADKVKFKDPDNQSVYLTTSSGVSFPGDDDLAIAMGYIEANQTSFNYNSIDTALSGTILHEVGHTLCLTSGTYMGQSAGCQFNGIDTAAGQSYVSVMNYNKQMSMVDYSHGVNGAPNDHDDWTAVLGGGIANFANADRNAGDSAGVSVKDKKPKKLARGITSEEAKALKKAGRLGLGGK